MTQAHKNRILLSTIYQSHARAGEINGHNTSFVATLYANSIIFRNEFIPFFNLARTGEETFDITQSIYFCIQVV